MALVKDTPSALCIKPKLRQCMSLSKPRKATHAHVKVVPFWGVVDSYFESLRHMLQKTLATMCPHSYQKRSANTTAGMQVRSLLPVGELCSEVEKRNKLRLLDKFLQLLVQEGSQDPQVHNAMGKILIDANSNPEHFLQSNPFYEPTVVGKYCEKR
jgi:hypothetical protein